MNPLPVIVACTNCLSGVNTWALRLRASLANHPRYRVRLLCVDTRPMSEADFSVQNVEEAEHLVSQLAPAMILPNYVWPLYLTGLQPHVRCIGMCHADSDEQYYRPLTWYEPMASHFLAVSPQCAHKLAQRLGLPAEDVTTLPYGVDVDPVLLRDYLDRPLRLIYAGRITHPQKRIRDIVPLLEQLQSAGLSYTVSIIGDGDELKQLRRTIGQLFPAQLVRFHGRLPPAQMKEQWQKHDVFIQFSDFEGTSLSMLEAMSHGVVPVVTAASSGVEGVIEHGRNGFVAPVGDVNALAASILHLAADRDVLKLASCSSHRTVLESFSQVAYIERFVEVLDRSMKTNPLAERARRYGPLAPPHPLLIQNRTIMELRAAMPHRQGVMHRLLRRWNRKCPQAA